MSGQRTSPITQTELDNRFGYHPPPDEETVGKYEELRGTARIFAGLIVKLAPYSRDQSLALTALEDCVMRANRAIALNPKE